MNTIIVKQIPIFITARGNTQSAIERNMEALKYSYVLIRNMNLFNQTYIISDNLDMLNYAQNLGFINVVYNECNSDYEINYLDYIGIYNFYKKTGFKPDWFILLAIGQLFKDATLIYDCIRNIDDSYDIIASYTKITDRSAFYINNNKVSTEPKLTHDRNIINMVDAAIYAIKSDFAIKCIESNEDPANVFWKEGKFKFFENNTLYADVKNLKEIKKYEAAGNIINKVKEINEGS